jgi:hypothetical protein
MDVNSYMVLAGASVTGLGMVTVAALTGWQGWLQLKRQELARDRADSGDGSSVVPSAGARIEIADLKERIRKLEAIAAGVDL